MNVLWFVHEYLPTIGTVGGLITVVLALRTYRRQSQLDRLKWLQQLYESFYCGEQYKKVRQLIDYGPWDKMLELLQKSEEELQQLNSELRNELDEFTDYLNFFEWIAFLQKKGQLAFYDLDVMFHYYLNRLVEIDTRNSGEIGRYISENHYGTLTDLLTTRYGLRTGGSNAFK